jgi:hypothetical protein
MRRITGYILSLLALTALPLPAHALLIEFCVPDCATGADTKFTVQSTPEQTVTDATGVTTTTIPLASFVHQGFTISATVSSQQSGTLQKITFNPTTIVANAGTGCTTAAPCRMEIFATSDPCDFPIEKQAGGYPAGVFMMGSFAGTQPAGNGDTIAMTGEASGATSSSTSPEACSSSDTRPVAIPITDDVINATPGTGPANVGVSLPSSCTGNPACKFMATTFKRAFSTQITETVQQVCPIESPTCLTRLRTKVNVEIKTAGNRVTLPLDHVTANPDPEPNPALKKNPTKQLITQVSPPFADMDVGLLEVGRNDFLLTAKLRLASDNPIDPSKEETFLRVGGFSMTIPPNRFKRLLNGKLYTFVGRIDGREMIVTFARDLRNANDWTFIAGVHDVRLKPLLPAPPLQVPVEIGVGLDTGKDLVTAHFF